MKFKTALGKAVGARLLREEPEAFQQVLGDVGKGILLAAGSHLSNELSKLSVGHDDEEIYREGDEIQPTVQLGWVQALLTLHSSKFQASSSKFQASSKFDVPQDILPISCP